MLCLAGVVTWYTSLLLASLDRHDGVRCAGGRSARPPENKCAVNSRLLPVRRHMRYCDLARSIYGTHS